MNSDRGYVHSHKKAGKGADYDERYETDPWRRFLWSREQATLRDIVGTYLKNREINLLDFACGTGRVCSFLEPYVKMSTGVDVSESMLEMARRKVKLTQLICADITTDGVLNGRKFNLITAFRFFLNAEPALREKALKAIVPLLSADGYLVFNNHRNKNSLLARLKYRLRRKPKNFMLMEEMYKLASDNGLEIIKIYPIGCVSLPKIKLPVAVNIAIDRVAAKFKCMENFSESPIAVCRLASVPRNS